jgi:transposase
MSKKATKKTSDNKPKRPMGNPTKFNMDLIPVVAKNMAADGKTIKQIAEMFEVHSTTVYRWFEKVPELRTSINEGRQQTDDLVEAAFLKRCLGMTVSEERDALTPQGGVERLTAKKELPPDTAACIKWLSARRPERWSDKLNSEIDECEVVVNANKPGSVD